MLSVTKVICWPSLSLIATSYPNKTAHKKTNHEYTGQINLAESKSLKPSAATELPNHARIKLIETTMLTRCNILQFICCWFLQNKPLNNLTNFLISSLYAEPLRPWLHFSGRKSEFKIYLVWFIAGMECKEIAPLRIYRIYFPAREMLRQGVLQKY